MCLYSNPPSLLCLLPPPLLSYGDFVFKLERRYLEVEDYALNTGWVSVSQGSGWAKLRGKERERRTLNVGTRRQITALSLSLSLPRHKHNPLSWTLTQFSEDNGQSWSQIQISPSNFAHMKLTRVDYSAARRGKTEPPSFTNSCEGLAPPRRPLPSLWLPNHIYKLPSIISAVALDSFALLQRENEGASPWVSSDTSLVMGEVEVTQVARSTETNSH